jgi:phosphoribosylaminoimidazole carboxylase (NCAIR synthetase)
VILRGYYLLRRVAASARINPLAAAMDRSRDQFYAQAWNEAAEAMGSTIVPVDDNFFRIVNGHGARAICVNRNLNPLDSQAAVSLTDDKPATSRVLSEAKIPVPEHLVVRANEHKAALEFLKSGRGPVVVKPAVGSAGGIGVSTNVATASQLRHAMAWAAAYCRQVMIERLVEGETCHSGCQHHARLPLPLSQERRLSRSPCACWNSCCAIWNNITSWSIVK